MIRYAFPAILLGAIYACLAYLLIWHWPSNLDELWVVLRATLTAVAISMLVFFTISTDRRVDRIVEQRRLERGPGNWQDPPEGLEALAFWVEDGICWLLRCVTRGRSR